MKTSFILLCAVVLETVAVAQSRKIEVPASIKVDFAKKYPTATKVNWEKEDGKYGSSFHLGNKSISVEYNADGIIEEVETRINLAALPPKAQQYLKQKGRILEIGKVELADGTIQYEAELKGKNLIFDNQGNFLEERI